MNNVIYVYSGFHFPDYSHQEMNLFKFQPAIANKNKLRKLSTNLYKIEVEQRSIVSKSGPSDDSASGGSMIALSNNDFILYANPKVYLFIGRTIAPTKCDLQQEFGLCKITYQEKNQNMYTCTTPICAKKIHLVCDQSIKKSVCPDMFCPMC